MAGQEDAMRVRTHYVVLGVPENADSRTIRHAFRSLARRYHPDVGSGSSATKFHEVAEAYNVLGDVGRRRQYDIDLARERRRPDIAPEPLIPSYRGEMLRRESGQWYRMSPIDPFASQYESPLVDWLDFLEFIFADRW